MKPWQMTQSEYLAKARESLPEHRRELWGNPHAVRDPERIYKAKHEVSVLDAIAEGHELPSRVLIDALEKYVGPEQDELLRGKYGQ